MPRVIEVSDEQYDRLRQTAEQRGQTLEELVSSLIAASTQDQSVSYDLDDFFRSLGASEEVLRESQRLFEEEEAQRGAARDADV